MSPTFHRSDQPPPATDPVLKTIVADLAEAFSAASMTRMRAGTARGIAWAEVSGRRPDAAWWELRLHHRPNEKRVSAGLLCYQPLARGGRTAVIGEVDRTYRLTPFESGYDITEAIRAWLALTPETAPESV